MANEYKQGVDRVAVDESFPYPIKLTYDDEYIYLTILKLPLEVMNTSYSNSDYNLCIEISDGSSKRIGKGHKRMHPNHGHGHPSTSGSFHGVCLGFEYGDQHYTKWNSINKGTIYTCPISYIRDHSSAINNRLSKFGNAYFKVRGTYRRIHQGVYVKTKIYSNTAKIFIQD